MSTRVIRQALEAKVQAFATANGNLPIAWEDVKFDQAGKVIWLKPVLYVSDTLNPTVGDNMYRQVGFIQVSVCVPEGTGTSAAEIIIDKLVDYFPRGSEVLREGLYIEFPRTPYSQQVFTLNTVRYYPVVIRYSVDVF